MEDRKIRVAITHGDTNGIGYELIFKTFSAPEMLDICTPVIYGSPKVAAYHRNALGLQVNYHIISKTDEIKDGRINLLTAVDEDVKVDFGQATDESAKAALKALDRAMTDFRDGGFDALVTAPAGAQLMTADGVTFKGQTSYIETSIGDGAKPLTVLLHDTLRIALLTPAMPLKDVSAAITEETLANGLKTFHKSLCGDLRIANPRIAVLALNPQKEDGGFGQEEESVILPVVRQLENEGMQVFGPMAADVLFGQTDFSVFDGIMALYQEQGLTPFKALATQRGVILTAGLPLVRTEADMSVGYDIAGRGEADETSFRQAVYTAVDAFRYRHDFTAPMAHPLPKLYHEKRDESEKIRFSIPKKKENPPTA